MLNGVDPELAPVLEILQYSANEYLKLRKNSKGFGVVTGEKVGRGTYNIRIPFDTRYQQDSDSLTKFGNEYSKGLNRKFRVMSGHMTPIM